MLLLLFCALV